MNSKLSTHAHSCLWRSLARLSLAAILSLVHTTVFAGVSTLTFDATGNTASQQSATPAAPTITGQPVLLQAAAPGTLTGFSVSISSTLAVTYQWYLNDVLIPGATGDSLLFDNPTAANEGLYTVTITNSLGSVTSNPSRLALDTNRNGLGDAWEQQFFGNLNQIAGGDFDGDQLTNLEEFTNGTNPTIRDPYYWTAASGSFDDPANWNWKRVPGLGDTAFINSGDFTITFSGAARLVNLTINRPFAFSSTANTSLTLSGTWNLNGDITIPSGRTLTLTSGTLNLNGPTTLTGANLIAQGNNTKFNVNGLTSYTQPNNMNVDWIAGASGSNAGCELSFPNLTTITGGITTSFSEFHFDLIGQTGATLKLPALTEITVPARTGGGDSGVRLYGIDNGLLAAPLLSLFSDASAFSSSWLLAYSGGTLSVPQLTAPSGVQLDLSATNFDFRQFSSLDRTWFIRLLGGQTQLNISNINYVRNIIVRNDGTRLSFPNVTSYTQSNNTGVEWRAGETGRTNAGCELVFPSLTNISGGMTTSFSNRFFDLIGTTGGVLRLPALDSINVTARTGGGQSGVRLYGIDSGTLSAPLLSQFNDASAYSNSTLLAYSGGFLLIPQLTAPAGVQLDISATNFDFQQFVSLERTWFIRLLGGVTQINIPNINYVRTIIARNAGTRLTFPNVTSYTQSNNAAVEWRAGEDGRTNTGCELNFPNLTTITGGYTTSFSSFYFELVGRDGGTLNLPALTSITVPAKTGGGASGTQLFAIDNGNLNAPLLTHFSDATSLSNSELNAYTGGRLSIPLLTDPQGIQLDLSATNFNLQQFVSLERTWFIRLLEGVAQINISNINYLRAIYAINNGTKLSFPNVTSYTQQNNTSVEWRAGEDGRTNTGCELNFPNLTTITGGYTTSFSSFYFELVGRDGGTLNLPALTSITVPAKTGGGASGTRLYTLDSGSLNAARLVSFIDLSNPFASRIEASVNSQYRFTSLRQEGITGVNLVGVTLLTGPVNLQPPTINSVLSASGVQGASFSYQITGTNTPTSYGATSLPSGLMLNAVTGFISGHLANAGTFNIQISATNPDGTSSAQLTVTVSNPSYEQFMENAGVPLAMRGDLDDPDKDGHSNLLEYALAMNPMAAGTTGLPIFQVAGGTVSFSYTKHRPNITYIVESSTTLGSSGDWTASGVNQGTPDTQNRVTATAPANTSKRFLRLKVQLVP